MNIIMICIKWGISMFNRKTRYLLTIMYLLTVFSPLVLPTSGIPIIETDPSTEIRHALVVPVYADDQLPETSISVLVEKMEFVRDYYLESSYSKITFHSHILGWMKLENNMSSYVGVQEYENGAVRTTVRDNIFTDIIDSLDSLDFSPFDTLVIVHAGLSDQMVSTEGTHIGTCYVPRIFRAESAIFHGASIVSEFDSFDTICHELGHQLGADDLYDYLREHSSLGPWCLMSSGSRGMCGYTKESLGFIDNHEIFYLSEGTFSLTLSALTYSTKGYRLVKYPLDDGRNLYIEARDASSGFDSGLAASGILVYIVNETSIAHKRGNNQIIWYNDTAVDRSHWWRDAILREGETLALAEYSLSLKFTESLDEGYSIIVSTQIENGWILCDRFQVNTNDRIRDIDIVWSKSPSGYFIFYAAVVINRDGWSELQIYNSTNFGRNWYLEYDSNKDFNVSSTFNDLVYYDSHLWYVARFEEDGIWYTGAGVYSEYSRYFGIWNLTKHHNATFARKPVAACNDDAMFVTISIGESTNRSFCFIQRRNNTWSSHIVPTYGEIYNHDMSDPLESKDSPWITFYNSTGKYLLQYNSTNITKLDDDRCVDLKITETSDSVVIASHSVENSTMYFRIHRWSVTGGTSLIVNENVSRQQLYAVFTDPVNRTWILARDNETLWRYTVQEEGFERATMELSTYPQNFAAPEINSRGYTSPLLLHYDGQVVSTISYTGTPPEDAESLLWFYHSDAASNGDPNAILEALVVIVALIGVVAGGIVYIKKNDSS